MIQEDEAKAAAREGLVEAIGKVAKERTTKSGEACIEAAQHLVELGELVEARQWVSLSLTADKVAADVKLHEAVEKLEQRGAKGAAFRKLRKGSKLKAVP